MAGQTISDRLLAAKHSIAGQGLAKSVCKATTEELLGPKKKHLDYLIHCTNEPNVSIPQLANLLIERSQNTNWVVVFKALITVHHLMCYGNERFTQYLASSNSTFQLSNFLDKSGVQAAGARLGYDMSPFIRRYARYLNEKALSYRTVAFDFCKVKRGKEDGVLRTMNSDKLLKTLPVLQSQLDALLEFDCTAADLANAVISMAFMLLFRDLIRLFAGYNDSIINLLEKYFEMNKKQCREALDLYKKFLIRMDRVGEFLKVAENVGIDKGEIPDLTKAPSSLLDALEQHLAALEGKKSVVNTPTQAATQQRTDFKTGVSALSSTSSSFGTAAQQSEIVDENTARQALAEEEAILNQYKQAKVQSPVSSIPNANSNANTTTTNPFLSSPAQQPIVDLFSAPMAPAASKNTNQTKASDDLLQLGNPFADMFAQPAAPVSTATAFNNNVSNNNIWMTNGFSNNKPSLTNAFVDDRSFTSVFGDTNTTSSSTTTTAASDGSIPSSVPFTEDAGDLSGLSGESEEARNLRAGMAPPPPRPPPPASGQPGAGTKTALDDLNDSIRVAMGSPSRPPPPASQQPLPVIPGAPGAQPIMPGYPPLQQQLYGSPVKFPPGPPGSVAACPTSTGTSKVITGDLESSIASLAENLTINKTSTQTKPIQWNSPAKGGNNAASWTPQPMAATTGVNYRPMVQGIPPTNPATTFPAAYSMGVQNMPAARMAVPPYNNVTMMNQPQQPIVPPQAQQATTLDPFGAL